MKKHHFIIFGVLVFITILVILFPFIINSLYQVTPPFDFFKVSFENKDLLSFYGEAFTFLGTIILGTITIIQTKRAQEKNDEVNKLTLEIQKKSMQMAEMQYKQSESDNNVIPKFELKLTGHHGNYSNPYLQITNVTSSIISGLNMISFCAKDENDIIINQAKEIKPKLTSLAPSQSCEISTVFRGINNPINKCKLILEFSCEDEKGKIHYYRSSSEIENIYKNNKNLWKIEKVG